MSEPTSAETYITLSAKVGRFAGWGGGGAAFGNADPAWTANQAIVVDDCVRSGCRKVYSPVPPYDWTWLHPFYNTTLSQGQHIVPLPDEFAGIEGDIVVTLATGSLIPRVRVTNPEWLRLKFAQNPTLVGWPRQAAIEAIKGTNAVAGSRQQLMIYPISDATYTLSFQYYITPDAPTVALPFVFGGAIHAETFVEACLAVYEERYDDMKGGVHGQSFQERLQASMAVDRRSKPQYLGRNRDTSDDVYGRRHYWGDFPQSVLYNGNPTN